MVQLSVYIPPFAPVITCRAEPSESGGVLMGAKSLCIPFTPPKPVEEMSSATKCVKCGEVAKTMFSSYRSIVVVTFL